MHMLENKNPSRDGGHYSPGVICNGMLYVSGQLSVDPATGKPAAGGIRAQTRQALKNLDAVLSLAGVPKENVVQCRVYTTDIACWADINEEYAAFFGRHRPARVVVPTNPLSAGCLVEIEAMAVCPRDAAAEKTNIEEEKP